MHNTPLVTVICLCYNHAAFVVEALESVLNQSHSHVELIIADDCSTDNSVEVIQSWLKNYTDIQFIANAQNLGNTKTFNQCLKIAKGDYIIDLAADDVLKPHCIAQQLQGFAESKYENLGLVFGNAEWITEKGNFIGPYFPTDDNGKVLEPQPTGDIYCKILSGESKLCSVAALTKRVVFDQLNGYDENLAYEDLDLWIRASRIYNFDYIDEIVVSKRVLDNSMYTLLVQKNNPKTRRFNYSTYLILQKAYQMNRNVEEHKALLSRFWLEMYVAFKTRDFLLLLKYVLFDLKVRFKILLT